MKTPSFLRKYVFQVLKLKFSGAECSQTLYRNGLRPTIICSCSATLGPVKCSKFDNLLLLSRSSWFTQSFETEERLIFLKQHFITTLPRYLEGVLIPFLSMMHCKHSCEAMSRHVMTSAPPLPPPPPVDQIKE